MVFMVDSNSPALGKRRGPKPTGKGLLIGVRLQQDLLSALDRFVAKDYRAMSRPEALRIAFRDWATAHGYVSSTDEGKRPEELNASNDD